VVQAAIENECWKEDLAELVDLALAGKNPAEFYADFDQTA
jgi:hypothetical protein